MNEQIKELAEQAGLYVDLEGSPWPRAMSAEECEAAYVKFAELLLKDVLSDLEYERGYYSDPMGYQDEEYYIRCAAKLDILDEVISTIKHRYGVK
jgi:hypothetical protein